MEHRPSHGPGFISGDLIARWFTIVISAIAASKLGYDPKWIFTIAFGAAVVITVLRALATWKPWIEIVGITILQVTGVIAILLLLQVNGNLQTRVERLEGAAEQRGDIETAVGAIVKAVLPQPPASGSKSPSREGQPKRQAATAPSTSKQAAQPTVSWPLQLQPGLGEEIQYEIASYAGPCDALPPGQACIKFSDGYVALVSDSLTGQTTTRGTRNGVEWSGRHGKYGNYWHAIRSSTIRVAHTSEHSARPAE